MRVPTGQSLAAVTLAPALLLLAQLAPAQSDSARRNSPVHRQPYTAEFKITSVQTLANGTTITRESTEVHALDSEGRQMTATTEIPAASDRPRVTRVHIYDPVDGTRIDWGSQSKRARVVKEPVGEERHGCWATDAGNFRMNLPPAPGQAADSASGGVASTSDHPGSGALMAPPAPLIEHRKPVHEDLGNTTILGVEARGTRTTWTTPAGEVGNDAPLVRISETWWGTGIGLLLREISDDPRSGKRDRELVNIELAEPPASTFQPPDGYEVVTDSMHPVDCGRQ